MKKILLALGVSISVIFVYLSNQKTTLPPPGSNEINLSTPVASASFEDEHFAGENKQPSTAIFDKNLDNDIESPKQGRKLTNSEQEILDSYQNTLSKHTDLKRQLERLKETDDESDQENLYQEIFNTVDESVANHHITNLEALNIKLVTAQNRFDDEGYLIESQKLRDSYSQESEEQWQEYLTNRDDNFLNYKKAQSELLARMSKMDEYPQGLSKGEYLKQELEKIKKEVYK